jgi:hypothetical protein
MVSGQMMLKTLLTLLASLSQKFRFGVQSSLLVSLHPSYCQADDDDVYIIKWHEILHKILHERWHVHFLCVIESIRWLLPVCFDLRAILTPDDATLDWVNFTIELIMARMSHWIMQFWILIITVTCLVFTARIVVLHSVIGSGYSCCRSGLVDFGCNNTLWRTVEHITS